MNAERLERKSIFITQMNAVEKQLRALLQSLTDLVGVEVVRFFCEKDQIDKAAGIGRKMLLYIIDRIENAFSRLTVAIKLIGIKFWSSMCVL